jgi:hypothetical protein
MLGERKRQAVALFEAERARAFTVLLDNPGAIRRRRVGQTILIDREERHALAHTH